MERAVAVLLQEIVQTQAELLKDHAHVTAVVKPFEQADAVVFAVCVILVQGVQDLQLQWLAGFRHALIESYLALDLTSRIYVSEQQMASLGCNQVCCSISNEQTQGGVASHLDDCSISIFFHVPNNLNGDIAFVFPVPAFQNPAERPCSIQTLLHQ